MMVESKNILASDYMIPRDPKSGIPSSRAYNPPQALVLHPHMVRESPIIWEFSESKGVYGYPRIIQFRMILGTPALCPGKN